MPWSSCLPHLSDATTFAFAKALDRPITALKKKRSQVHHAIVVTCPLKLARRKALEEKFSRLKGKGSENMGDIEGIQSVAKAFNDDAMDLNEDYVDVEDPQPAANSHKPDAQK